MALPIISRCHPGSKPVAKETRRLKLRGSPHLQQILNILVNEVSTNRHSLFSRDTVTPL